MTQVNDQQWIAIRVTETARNFWEEVIEIQPEAFITMTANSRQVMRERNSNQLSVSRKREIIELHHWRKRWIGMRNSQTYREHDVWTRNCWVWSQESY